MNNKKPLLIMLPGLDGTGDLLKIPAEHLNHYFETKILSYPSNVKIGYHELCDYLFPLLPNEEPFYLLAESFGGPLALDLALKKKNQVKAIILSATFISNPLYFFSLLKGLSSILPIHYIPSSIIDFFILSNKSPKTSHILKETLHFVHPDVIHYRIQEVFNLKINPSLSELKMPILYFEGKYDHLVFSHNYKNLKKLLPQTQHILLNTGHLVLQTLPEETKNNIIQFIKNNN